MRRRYTSEDWIRVGKAVCDLANAALDAEQGGTRDGHFTILGFTTNVKASIGTPLIMWPDGYGPVSELPGFETVEEAATDALTRGELPDWDEVRAAEWADSQ